MLALLALGVVYGDIGTSPLYALRECFDPRHGVALTEANIIGVLSLITWSLLLVISVKYLALILRADNHGEGGILALMALARQGAAKDARIDRRTGAFLLVLGLFGAALLYGDAMLTPAISVLSAVEGVRVAAPALDPLVIPLTVAILIGLFMFQRRGTARVGALFGPIALLWFGVLAFLGLGGIVDEPRVLAALDPRNAATFLVQNGAVGFFVLGSVFLVVTGGEAIYADMGHFGARPIRVAWSLIVLPALLLNYYGQGALLLEHPEAVHAPFFLLAPSWALYPLIALAAAATVIASQAVISAVYSLTMQAVHLGYLPRLQILHTSVTTRGQIYVPTINLLLAVATVGLVVSFRSSGALAAAYGMAVTSTMLITTILFGLVARIAWRWSWWILAPLVGAFLVIDLAFFAANLPKIPGGGWFPLLVASGIFLVMTTWRTGRRIVLAVLTARPISLSDFAAQVHERRVPRVPGAAVYPTATPDGAPAALLRNLAHNRVLHERVLVLHVETTETAYVDGDRYSFEALGDGLYRMVARFGFMERPHMPTVLVAARLRGFSHDPNQLTYFLGRDSPVAARNGQGMAPWRERLFLFLSRNSFPAMAHFHLPPAQVIEVGAHLELVPPGPHRDPERAGIVR